MADSIVTSFWDNLAKLVATQEGNLLRGAEDQLKILEDSLIFIDDFLEASVAEQSENGMVKEVVDQISDVVLEAEDDLERYMAKVLNHGTRNLMLKLRGGISSGRTKVFHDITKKIKSMEKTIEDDIYEQSYSITKAKKDDEASLERRRRISKINDDDDVVGFGPDNTLILKEDSFAVVGLEQHKKILVDQLVNRDRKGLDVISIIGMGGLGKTTLAGEIYNDIRVRNEFEFQAWVCVSQEFKSKEFLLGILKCLMPISKDTRRMSHEELKQKLKENLQDKEYLIVMDDVWAADFWVKVGEAFPNNPLKRSRILITRRTKEARTSLVATTGTPPYFLSNLDKDQSWQLFSNKVFGRENCPPQLETLAWQLAESCKGLPISVVLLGSLLANKDKSYTTWSKLLGDVNSNHDESAPFFNIILATSYNHLSRHLKSCFLYLGVFPVDFEIPARQLVELWLAEGLIIPPTERSDTRTLVDVAEEYLEQLVDRSLIQVTGRRSDGGVKTCHIPSLLRDFAMLENDRERFVEVHSEANPSPTTSKVRRLSIQGNISEFISSYSSDPSCVRSLFLFCEENDFDTKQWRWIYKYLKFIRVLCIEKVNLSSIPDHLEKLIFLRYLRIWNEEELQISELPASICSLQFLETIEVKGHLLHCLPREIISMKRLKHLNFSGGMTLPETTSSDTSSSGNYLQVLSYLLVGKFSDLVTLRKLRKLRKLHLKYVDNNGNKKNESDMTKVEESLETLRLLRSLKVVDFPKSEILQNLFRSTLVKITIVNSYLDSTHLEILGKLENLRFLKLKGENPSSLSCVAGEFRKLQVFQMIDMNIETWELRKNSMVELQRLVVFNCSQLRYLPNELWNLKALRLVEVSGMSESFTKMLNEMEMKNGCKLISHNRFYSTE